MAFWLISLLCVSTQATTTEKTRAETGEIFVAGSFAFSRGSKDITYGRDLIRQALTEYGYRLEVKHFPGRRLGAQLNSGAIDGDMGRAFDMSQGSDTIIRVPEPIRSECALLYRLNTRGPLVMDDAENPVSVGIFAGAPGGARMLLNRWPKVKLVHYENLKQGALMLSHERIDLVAIGALQRNMLINHTERPLAVEDAFALPPIYMHVHQRHAALAPRLAASIKRLKQQFPPPNCHLADFTTQTRQTTP